MRCYCALEEEVEVHLAPRPVVFAAHHMGHHTLLANPEEHPSASVLVFDAGIPHQEWRLGSLSITVHRYRRSRLRQSLGVRLARNGHGADRLADEVAEVELLLAVLVVKLPSDALWIFADY